jgi:hypothetical protein
MLANTGQVRPSSEQLAHYLRQLTPQARSHLLAELERLHLLGDDIPHCEELINLLRAEFRKTGESHYRAGNPSRYFFEPLEPVLVDLAPECANAGQVARGSLAPIWSLITEKLLPSMAEKYICDARQAIVGDRQQDARRIAAGFQNKVVSYLQRTLESDAGLASIREGLSHYTSSRAIFDDLNKMLFLIQRQKDIAEFGRSLQSKIAKLDGATLVKVFKTLDTLRARSANAVPFGLTMIARRLELPYELMNVAISHAGSRSVSRIAATPYAAAIPMVLDQIEEKRHVLRFALKKKCIKDAKDAVVEIFRIEEALRSQIDLESSEWGARLARLMATIQSTLQAEIDSIPTDHRHLVHVFESIRPNQSVGSSVGRMLGKGRDALLGLLSS